MYHYFSNYSINNTDSPANWGRKSVAMVNVFEEYIMNTLSSNFFVGPTLTTGSMKWKCYELWGSEGGENEDVKLLVFSSVWICRSMPTFRRNWGWSDKASALSLQPWRWKQHVSLRRRCLPTRLHGIITQKNNIKWTIIRNHKWAPQGGKMHEVVILVTRP